MSEAVDGITDLGLGPLRREESAAFRRIEEALRETDPRDYIPVSAFQKQARLIDPDLSHPWEKLPVNYFWARDLEGEVAVAKVYDDKGEKYIYLVAERSKEETTSAVCLRETRSAVGDFVLELLETAGRRFPSDKRQEFFRKVIGMAEKLSEMSIEDVAEVLVSAALELLEDHPRAARKEIAISEFPRAASGPSFPDKEKVERLQRFLDLVRTKIPEREFDFLLGEIFTDIPYTDEAYGINYPYVFFGDIFRRVIDIRLGPPGRVSRESIRDLTRRFPVEQLVRRKISSLDELVEVLEREPVRPMPDIRNMENLGVAVEFVEIDKILGAASSLESWARIKRTGRRGEVESIMDFVEGFAEGKIDINGRNEPICVVEVDGKYFVAHGNHRVAALKALGVPFAPMIVTHYREKE